MEEFGALFAVHFLQSLADGIRCAMQYTRLLFLVVLLVLPASAGAQSLFRAKVMTVHDGDTYRVLREDGRLTDLRLWGADAPERRQPYGATVQQTVQRLIGGQTVRVSVEDHDPYGRPVVRIEIDGEDLSSLLVRRGLAWHDGEQAPNAGALRQLEERARQAERGLWTQSNPTPPWRWREQSTGSSSSRCSTSLSGCVHRHGLAPPSVRRGLG